MTLLLEREREQAELDELIDGASAGRGGFVVIEASAGLGKTRLVQAARERGQAAGLRVLGARASELERAFPFALVRQLFEPRLAELGARARATLLAGAAGGARGALGLAGDGRGPADAFAVLHGLYWLTAGLAEAGPLMLAVDDAHWADAASLDFLAFLVPRLEELPVLLVLACRPAEPGAERRLGQLATDAFARRLTPRPLSHAAAAALLAQELRAHPDDIFTSACHEVSGGNPFLLHELARTLAADAVRPEAGEAPRVRELAPERVTRTVLVRLARLSPAAQAVAQAVVVLGDGTDGALAAALAKLSDREAASGADELRASAILAPSAALRFAHPLVRTALDAELPAGARAEMHARAVELLRARGAGPEQLAIHLLATGPRGDRATAETLLAAGRTGLARGAPRAALAILQRALDEPAPSDLRPAVLSSLITAGIRAPDLALFAALLPEVLGELERDPLRHVRWASRVSIWMILNGRAGDAVPLLTRAIELAADQDDAERAFRLEAQLSLVAPRSLTRTRARLEPYLARVPADSSAGRLAAALESEWHAYDGTAADATAAARRALARQGAIFAEQPEFFAPGRPVLALILADELDEARRAADHAIASARERSATPEMVAALWMSSGVAWAMGDLAAGEADARQALQVARLGRLGLAVPTLQAQLAVLLVARGELGAAEAEMEAADAYGAQADAFVRVVCLFARGHLRHAQGRFEDAADDFLELHRRSRAWGVIGSPSPPPDVCAARALAAAGDLDRARPLAAGAVARAERWGAATLRARALGALAMTAAGGDRLAALHEAVAVLDGSPARLARAEALADLGAALRRAGQRADARVPLREALELARRCGATGLAKVASDELVATGERVRRHTPIGVESLTPSERRVAEMAARGMTNRQIAQTLFLTVKTIETHLAAAYDKLGIRSRRHLPTALGEVGGAGLEPATPRL